MSHDKTTNGVLMAAVAALVLLLCNMPLQADDGSFLGPLHRVATVASTVPANGDVNPYGIFQVPESHGNLIQGHFLISNFNNSANLQGTGTTIVDIDPTSGTATLFAQIDPNKLNKPCPGGIGLTTALVILKKGWVIVGSLPTSDGTSGTAQAGCLLVLDSHGNVAEVFAGGPINGPWDATVKDDGDTANLFFTNVLNGTVAGGGNVVNKGTVVRATLSVSDNNPPRVTSAAIIGSKFSEKTDPDALVVGPTGLALSDDGDVLYVADSVNNRVAAISNPLQRKSSGGNGTTLSKGGALTDPLGLSLAHDGHVLAANGGNGLIIEITPDGHQIAARLVDKSGNPPGAGALFGLVAVSDPDRVYFVDDATNTLNVLEQ
jgi:DNA-binding beta-propeller fold protein YncE